MPKNNKKRKNSAAVAGAAAAGQRQQQKQQQSSSSSPGASMDDWISSLAKQATKNSADSAASAGVVILSKEARKQKRAAKKARRTQAKHQQHVQKQQQQQHKQQQYQHFAAVSTKNNENNNNAEQRNRQRLKKLSITFNSIRKLSTRKSNKDSRNQPYICCNERPKRKRKPWNQDTIQPRPNDYSGIGLARDSLWVSFLDPSFRPKLEEEFQQHIPGFYGKQRTKAMKKQLDSNMLWRQLANNKIKLGKKYQSMTPDQRIEAMIQSGMV